MSDNLDYQSIKLMVTTMSCFASLEVLKSKNTKGNKAKRGFDLLKCEPQSQQRQEQCTEVVKLPSTNVAHCCITLVRRQAFIRLHHNS